MKRSLYNAWLKALETAPKTKRHLKDDTGMCCLGVLCSITPEATFFKGDNDDVYTVAYGKDTSSSVLPWDLSFELGINVSGASKRYPYATPLTILNDANDTFEPVIAVLRNNPEHYFNIEED